jgi:hypothetical protein
MHGKKAIANEESFARWTCNGTTIQMQARSVESGPTWTFVVACWPLRAQASRLNNGYERSGERSGGAQMPPDSFCRAASKAATEKLLTVVIPHRL